MLVLWRLLALMGIGGFYLHKDYVWRDEHVIEGPYNYPHNPYRDHRLYGMHFEVKYYLRKPKGATSPKEIGQ
jgi:hypothetical protein